MLTEGRLPKEIAMHIYPLLIGKRHCSISARASEVERCPSVAVGWVARFAGITFAAEVVGEQYFVAWGGVLDRRPYLDHDTGT